MTEEQFNALKNWIEAAIRNALVEARPQHDRLAKIGDWETTAAQKPR